jgi:hypothetical protein
VRSAIQQIAVKHRRRYGYRRIAAELRRCGMLVNHKRVARIMREDNLLAVQPRAFVVTTDSQHQLEVYLNLASRMKLTGVNQLWVADIHEVAPDLSKGLTSPVEAKQFVESTGIDVLAPAVGNMHGMSQSMVQGEKRKRLDIERIAQIKTAARVPLTLHGGSHQQDC